MEKKTLGSFIAVLRKAKGLTQKQLAELLNVSDKAVSRWERDECAPDLSVIPVLAEIFGITADELLRGQRKQPDEPTTHYEVQKTEKQLRYLLKKKETDYTILCCASIVVALFGLIAAMIANLGFLRAYIGFFVSCFFFIPAVLCQVIFLVQGLRSLDAEELEERSAHTRKVMILQAELSFSICACLFAACLPLILLVTDTYAGLSTDSWGEYGLLWALYTTIVCAAVCTFINIRLGYQRLPDMKKPRNKLRLRAALILIAFLFVTLIAHIFIDINLEADLNLLGEGTKWEKWEDLKAFLETPMTPDGEPMTLFSTAGAVSEYVGPDGTIYHILERETVFVYHEDMETPEYACVKRNESIHRFSFSLAEDHLPIYTFDSGQLIRAENKRLYINLAICSVYILEIIAAIILYRRRAKRLIQPA